MDTAAQTTPSAPSSPKSTPAPGTKPGSSTDLPATATQPGAANPPAQAPAASVSAPGTANEKVAAPADPASAADPAKPEVTRDGTTKADFFTSVRGYARNVTMAAQKLSAALDAAGHSASAELDQLNESVTAMNDHLNSSGRTASTPIPGEPIKSNSPKASQVGTAPSPLSNAAKDQPAVASTDIAARKAAGVGNGAQPGTSA